MKIAIACADIKPNSRHGGIAIYTAHLATGLANRGHQVTVLGSGPSRSTEIWPSGVQVQYIPINSLWTPHPKLALVSEMLARSKSLASYLRHNEHFDVVEFPVWNAEGLHGTRIRGIRSVVRGHTPHVVVNDLTEAAGKKVAKVDRIAAMFEKRSARQGDLFLANSESSRVMAMERFGLHSEKVRSCLHGIPMPESCINPKGDSVRALFVGRLEPRKGVLELFRAIPEVLANFPSLVFEVVGADGANYIKQFRDSHAEPVNRQVIFHGRLEDDELDRVRAQCQFAVLPSLYESFGLVHVEALSYGLPVIAFDISATREVVSHLQTGLLVACGDSNQLRDAICRLAGDSELRVELGQQAIQDARSRFSVESMAECVEQAYLALLSGASR